MWFYDDKPYKGTCPDDQQDDESSDSAGYADWKIEWLFAAFVLLITGAVAMLVQPLVARLWP